tara:strand:+ start:566 stop:841 length:276 start_codon:yes stop_codon:yes gene_type:complete
MKLTFIAFPLTAFVQDVDLIDKFNKQIIRICLVITRYKKQGNEAYRSGLMLFGWYFSMSFDKGRSAKLLVDNFVQENLGERLFRQKASNIK